jgi:hypothetical protein
MGLAAEITMWFPLLLTFDRQRAIISSRESEVCILAVNKKLLKIQFLRRSKQSLLLKGQIS